MFISICKLSRSGDNFTFLIASYFVNSIGALESGSNFPVLIPSIALCCKALAMVIRGYSEASQNTLND